MAGFIGVSPRGLTLRTLWDMAAGKRLEQRRLLVQQSITIGWLLSPPTTATIESFVERGDPSPRTYEHSPEIAAKVAEELAKLAAKGEM